ISQANDITTTEAKVPKRFDLVAEALAYPVKITVNVGGGLGVGKAWGCDLSYDYVKINAEYTT
ncbi:MAG: arginine biosynthesis bifunctional protein ArgJ, partial [Leptolyngbya sp. SIO3F4]|nr:arginine biosynthesis bifunctional protein ArgJ [Leptolyngbya sp. SIO3F4]